MDEKSRYPQIPFSLVILYGILFLFFFQLLADFVESIYVFGLLGTSIPPEIVSVLFFFSPVLLLFFRKAVPPSVVLSSGALVAVSRLLEVMLETREAMIVSGIGVAAFLIFLPGVLLDRGRRQEKDAFPLGIGLMVAIATSILLRTLNSSVDISVYGYFQVIGWILALIAGYLLWKEFAGGQQASPERADMNTAPLSKIVALSLGISSIILILYFGFLSPNVISRWTGFNYLAVVLVEMTALGLCAWAWFFSARFRQLLSSKVMLLLNLVFVLSLVLAILPHQIIFPKTPEGYPLVAAPDQWAFYIPLILALLTLPVIPLDFLLFANEIIQERPSARTLGAGFTLAALFLLLVVLAYVFTTVYDYIPVIGPFFRDKFWLVYLVAGLALLTAFSASPKKMAFGIPARSRNLRILLGFLISAGMISALGIAIKSPHPKMPPPTASSLRIFTYNVQQGYSEGGSWNFDGQLELIRGLDPDVIGLQESDTNRIAGGNNDLVGYFAGELDMYSYYGPKTTTGTFGIALLSKYPIQSPKTYYLYSLGEQVAVIEAQISVGGEKYNIYVTHLGNGGPIIQQEELLEIIGAKSNVIAMGDFNFRPASEQYDLTLQLLNDAYLRITSAESEAGFDPADRIDHVFVSPDVSVFDVTYLLGPQSDHPAMFVVLGN